MKIKFVRNTHDECGNYRGNDYFVNSKGEIFGKDFNDPTKYTGVHTFVRREPLTFEEYYELLLKAAIGGAYHPKPPVITISEALRELSTLIEYKLVDVLLDYEIQELQTLANQKADK